jgi:hypothetical protein
MKFRSRGDTIRLRLKRSEVDRIATGASIVEETHFPDSVLTYRLDVSDVNAISASFDNGSIAITVPKSTALDWASSDDVSLHAYQKLPGMGSLSLLIEKDFSCLDPGHHRDSKDDEDTFPHPSAQSMSRLQA